MSNTSPLPLAESTSHNIPGSYNNQPINQENENSMLLIIGQEMVDATT